MEAERFQAWVERYRAVWESNDPAEVGALFTDDALYHDSPGQAPWTGRDAIVKEWIDRKDEPGETTFEYDVIASEGDLGLVRGVTHYLTNGNVYDNLWEIVLDGEDRCSRFTEWWMLRR
ncbi:MAG: nuclear transport factor 2 family protein [Actinobacteria bacterium]|nr:nuclear transport factor 2 family protein [Actinomycetota bacterium]